MQHMQQEEKELTTLEELEKVRVAVANIVPELCRLMDSYLEKVRAAVAGEKRMTLQVHDVPDDNNNGYGRTWPLVEGAVQIIPARVDADTVQNGGHRSLRPKLIFASPADVLEHQELQQLWTQIRSMESSWLRQQTLEKEMGELKAAAKEAQTALDGLRSKVSSQDSSLRDLSSLRDKVAKLEKDNRVLRSGIGEIKAKELLGEGA